MSGKFMRIKKLILPTLTMVIIASQLMGCAATNESELLQMLNTGQQIEIEIATPISEEQGEEKTLDWIQLDQLSTYANFRKSLDDIMKITRFGDNSKNGICYIGLDGQQEGNNTLYNALRAGALFLGEYSSEPLGDYFAGPNHILPTNGTAKFFSPLNVDDFMKKTSIIAYSEEALRAVHKDIELFAQSEGLTAHANSIKVRFEE